MNCRCCYRAGSCGKEDLCFQVDVKRVKEKKGSPDEHKGSAQLWSCGCSSLIQYVLQLYHPGLDVTGECGHGQKASRNKYICT